MKGIVMAGGAGSRLFPVTDGVSKHLLPVYDKPMIYYPISVLMLAGIRDILIIVDPTALESYVRLLGNGDSFGLRIEYAVQEEPSGVAQAFLIGEYFVGDEATALVLGDNLFWGQGFGPMLENASADMKVAQVFGYQVADPSRFGVAEFDELGEVVDIVEKPRSPKSNVAVTGLYFYPPGVVEIAKTLTPSSRGELEISDLNKYYCKSRLINMNHLGRGFAWLDTGTHDSLHEASNFIAAIEKRQGFKVACLEEIAVAKNWISTEKLIEKLSSRPANSYYDYIRNSVLK